MINLTAFNRNDLFTRKASRNDSITKPYIRLIDRENVSHYLKLEVASENEINPKFCVWIEGVKYVIIDVEWFLDFVFSSASLSYHGIVPNEKVVTEFDVTFFGSFGATSYTKWKCGVLASNGKVYCFGNTSSNTTVLEIDHLTKTTTTFGYLEYSRGATLHKNGKIYVAGESSIKEVDIENKTISSFGSAPSYTGLVLAPSGNMYSAPFSSASNKVIEINPIERTVIAFGGVIGGQYSNNKYHSGVIGNDGMIYFLPNENTSMLKIDPTTRSLTQLGSYAGNTKWCHTFNGYDGKIYASPQNSPNFFVYDIENKTITLLETTGLSRGAFKLAPNGKYYSFDSAGKLIENDLKSLSNNGRVIYSSSVNYCSSDCVLTADGKLVAIPSRGADIKVIDCGVINNNGLLSPYYNKF